MQINFTFIVFIFDDVEIVIILSLYDNSDKKNSPDKSKDTTVINKIFRNT